LSPTPNPNYLHYSRNTLNAFESKEPFLILNLFKNLIKSGDFKVPFEYKTETGDIRSIVLVASQLDELEKDDNRYGTSSLSLIHDLLFCLILAG
jgi:hypothetical protein